MSTDNISDRKSETYTGHDAVGPDGETIGKITDVIYEDRASRPAWLVVKPGVLRAAHYAPVEGSYTTNDGRVVLPFNKSWVKDAPKASGDHVVDADLEHELVDHYGSEVN